MVRDLAAPEPRLDEILAEGAKAMRDYPSLALAFELAKLRDKMGDRAGAVRELGVAAYLTRLKAEDWGLMADAAETLTLWDDGAAAVKVWATILKQELPTQLRMIWLEQASATAKAAKQFDQMIQWDRDLSVLKGR
tara:strand:- start:23 stop:430 length:408 start_codon:yes stop_codon:yes gene_type:complete